MANVTDLAVNKNFELFIKSSAFDAIQKSSVQIGLMTRDITRNMKSVIAQIKPIDFGIRIPSTDLLSTLAAVNGVLDSCVHSLSLSEIGSAFRQLDDRFLAPFALDGPPMPAFGFLRPLGAGNGRTFDLDSLHPVVPICLDPQTAADELNIQTIQPIPSRSIEGNKTPDVISRSFPRPLSPAIETHRESKHGNTQNAEFRMLAYIDAARVVLSGDIDLSKRFHVYTKGGRPLWTGLAQAMLASWKELRVFVPELPQFAPCEQWLARTLSRACRLGHFYFL